MKTFNQRVLEAKAIAGLGKVITTDKNRRAKTTVVPGSNGTQNHGIVRRFGNGVITTECRKITGVGHENCPGNYRSVCRHSLASVILATKYHGFVPRFRRNRQDAEKLAKKLQESIFCNEYGNPIVFEIHSHNLDNRIKARKVGNGYVSWIGKEPIFHKLTFTCIEDATNYWKSRYSVYMIILEEDLV